MEVSYSTLTACSHLDTAATFGLQQAPLEKLQDCCNHGSAPRFGGRLSEVAATYLGKSLLPQPSTTPPIFTFTHKLTGRILLLDAIQMMAGESSSRSSQNKHTKKSLKKFCGRSNVRGKEYLDLQSSLKVDGKKNLLKKQCICICSNITTVTSEVRYFISFL